MLVNAIDAPPEEERKEVKVPDSVDSPSIMPMMTPVEEKPNELSLNGGNHSEAQDVQMEAPGS